MVEQSGRRWVVRCVEGGHATSAGSRASKRPSRRTATRVRSFPKFWGQDEVQEGRYSGRMGESGSLCSPSEPTMQGDDGVSRPTRLASISSMALSGMGSPSCFSAFAKLSQSCLQVPKRVWWVFGADEIDGRDGSARVLRWKDKVERERTARVCPRANYEDAS